MSAIFAVLVLRYFSEYWLFGAILVVGAVFGASYGGLDGAFWETSLTLIAGGFAMIWARTSRAMWRVERERWDRADRGEPPLE